MLVSILTLSQELSPQLPCPSLLRFQVDFGPFWGKKGRPCLKRQRCLRACRRMACPCGILATQLVLDTRTKQGSVQIPALDGAPLAQHLGEGQVLTTRGCGLFLEKRLDPVVCGVIAAQSKQPRQEGGGKRIRKQNLPQPKRYNSAKYREGLSRIVRPEMRKQKRGCLKWLCLSQNSSRRVTTRN